MGAFKITICFFSAFFGVSLIVSTVVTYFTNLKGDEYGFKLFSVKYIKRSLYLIIAFLVLDVFFVCFFSIWDKHKIDLFPRINGWGWLTAAFLFGLAAFIVFLVLSCRYATIFSTEKLNKKIAGDFCRRLTKSPTIFDDKALTQKLICLCGRASDPKSLEYAFGVFEEILCDLENLKPDHKVNQPDAEPAKTFIAANMTRWLLESMDSAYFGQMLAVHFKQIFNKHENGNEDFSPVFRGFLSEVFRKEIACKRFPTVLAYAQKDTILSIFLLLYLEFNFPLRQTSLNALNYDAEALGAVYNFLKAIDEEGTLNLDGKETFRSYLKYLKGVSHNHSQAAENETEHEEIKAVGEDFKQFEIYKLYGTGDPIYTFREMNPNSHIVRYLISKHEEA
ncbi:MAG: hypothetical protein LBQ48_06665 [Oscillospiraceae bacterium]|nr:hypothetical protein [Oscillospiraceae bacterium]